MSILVRFTGAPSMTAEKYDDTLPLIEEQRASGRRTGSSITSRSAPVATSGSVKSGTRRSSLRRSVSA